MLSGGVELFGRETACRLLGTVIDELRAGAGGSLMLTGDIGMGKTALLRYAADRAHDLRVLTAAGVPAETGLPFAGLHGLLRPLLPLLPRIPQRQRTALSAGLAVSAESTDDVFAIAAGTLSLLAAAADDVPVLVLVDGVHQWDETSQAALLFAARRAGTVPVGVILASGRECLDEDDCGVPTYRIPPLDAAASRQLLRRASADPIVPAVADRLVAAAGGVPLALAELPGVLTPGQRAGTDPLPDPPPVGGATHRALLPGLAPLGPVERAALVVAAAAGEIGLPAVLAVLDAQGLPAAALESAETHGVIDLGAGGVTFRHPLLRAVAYHEASVAHRRAVHRAIAAVTSGGTRARHLGCAALGPGEETAAELERAARTSVGTAAVSDAAQLMQRAAELSEDGRTRAQRCVRTAELWQAAGVAVAADEVLEGARRLGDDVWVRANVQALAARVEYRRGCPAQAYRLLIREAVRVRDNDPDAAVLMLLDAAEASWLAGAPHGATVAAQQARQIAANGAPGLRDLCAVQHAAILARGGALDEARRVLADRRAALDRVVTDADAPVTWWRVLWVTAPAVLAAFGEREAAARLAFESLGRARDLSAYGILPSLLALCAELHRYTGDWDGARALAAEAADLADELGQATDGAAALLTLAQVAAARGDHAECAATLERFRDVCAHRRLDGLGRAVDVVEGLLALGAGEHAAAYARLQGLTRGGPADLSWLPDLVEAAIAAGHRDVARSAVAAHREHGADDARCAALLAPPAGAEDAFAAALARDLPVFDRARTELCLGEWRVAHDRPGAAEVLAAAAATFDRLGARPWADRARRALPGGAWAPAAPAPVIAGLTLQERKVALLVGHGATNREAAGALYVSPKTIEFHLRSVFRKVGVRSRAELAHMIGQIPQGAD
ncbi:helix-turn-helix transcriptional regulator [Catenuloplanes niger]|nr:AAA family ATPase [Catenuloplanes niger]